MSFVSIDNDMVGQRSKTVQIISIVSLSEFLFDLNQKMTVQFSASVFAKFVNRLRIPPPASVPNQVFNVVDLEKYRRPPYRVRFGAGTATVIMGAGIYFGAWLSEQMAIFLQENEIFIPDEDDD